MVGITLTGTEVCPRPLLCTSLQWCRCNSCRCMAGRHCKAGICQNWIPFPTRRAFIRQWSRAIFSALAGAAIFMIGFHTSLPNHPLRAIYLFSHQLSSHWDLVNHTWWVWNGFLRSSTKCSPRYQDLLCTSCSSTEPSLTPCLAH